MASVDKVLSLLLEAISLGYEDAKELIKKKVGPMPLQYLKGLGLLALISLIPSIALIWAGIYLNSRWLLVLGGTWRTVCTMAILILLTPFGLIVEVARGGKEGSGKRWANIISGTFVGELFFTLVIAVLLDDVRTRPDLLPIFMLSSIILGSIGGVVFGRGFIATSTALVFLGIIATWVFPGPINVLVDKWRGKNELKHFMVYPKDLKAGKVKFFDHNGTPCAWYAPMDVDKKKDIKCIELFNREGHHPINGIRLKPINKPIVDIIIETEGRAICTVCISDSPQKPEKREADAPPPTPPPPPPAPPAPPPPSYSELNLVGRWNFCWSKPNAQAVCFPAIVEISGNVLSISLLSGSGSAIARFNGSWNAGGNWSGRWNMENQSGRGQFHLSTWNANYLTGSMNDETENSALFARVEMKR